MKIKFPMLTYVKIAEKSYCIDCELFNRHCKKIPDFNILLTQTKGFSDSAYLLSCKVIRQLDRMFGITFFFTGKVGNRT